MAARSSTLSRRQVDEVYSELKQICPDVVFDTTYLKAYGDHDHATSLRKLEKSDFFTREIDQMVLDGVCRVAIHSAKDLPDPLPTGLVLCALTRGLDPSDSLVMRDNECVEDGFVIATSSFRREAIVRSFYKEVKFVDIRGSIEQRLDKLYNHEIDALVVAEAAIIRLGLTHLNRINFSGVETQPLQGKLAVVCMENDYDLISLFSLISVIVD